VKAVILAGGYGTRLAEETVLHPKPMVEIGGKPILWHIMKIYAHHGITDFVICLGYKGYVIKEYFANYVLHNADVTVDLAANAITYHENQAEPWRVTLVDTGLDTMTGGRIKRVAAYLEPDEPFCMTYGDGVSDVDIGALVGFHRREGRAATVTTVQPLGRFGATVVEGTRVVEFIERSAGDDNHVNGGFFVLEPEVLDYIAGDGTMWEREPLSDLARDGKVSAFRHDGFWQPMDTLREKHLLEEIWSTGHAPWKVW
jgi:glucose-1-phosphate cytidylyltransferase